MRYVGIAAALLGVAFLGAALYVRYAPINLANAHVDPRIVVKAQTPNNWLARPAQLAEGADAQTPVFNRDAHVLAEDMLEVAMDEGRTELLMGMPEKDLHMTFVQRSRYMRFPDLISVKIEPSGEGRSTISIYSRSIYGHSDAGVNQERVERWLADLKIHRSAPRPSK